jgi:hypothetical protein
MKNTTSDDWCDINIPTSIKDSLNINNELLSNILKIVITLEETVKSNTNKIDELSKKIDLNLINIDRNMKEIDNDIENEINTIHDDMNIIKKENQDTRQTLMENREIFTRVMDKFITLENDEIKPILNQINNNQTKMSNNSILLPSFEKTIEQNRLWRLYSNNFRQNVSTNTQNIITQLSLSSFNDKI